MPRTDAADSASVIRNDSQSRARRLGQILVDTGVITEADLQRAVNYQSTQGVKLGRALVALELVNEAQLAEALKEQGRFYCVRLVPQIVDREVACSLGEEYSRREGVLAINHIAGITTVVMTDPTDLKVVDDIGTRLSTRVQAVYADEHSIHRAMAAAFVEEREAGDVIERLLSTDFEGSPGLFSFEETEEREEEVDEQPVVSMIQAVVSEAMESGASDIHFEPGPNSFAVRLRVDGSLFERASLPRAWARPCLARLKVMSNLDIAQRRLPQDGRTRVHVGSRRVDLRVATTPTLAGEGAVIRLLDTSGEARDISTLDLEPPQLQALEAIIGCPEGFFLSTGPTGSGKTTTLYALLAKLNTVDRKIITLEDPVEYEVERITQINTDSKIGLTFSRGLRSILRQDPDVLLVGEIRDRETAEIAVEASLTGHLVLSTLHTLGTAESIVRLDEIGIEPYLLADTLRGLVAQRLVRRICSNCRCVEEMEDATLRRLGIADEGQEYHTGEVCDRCHGTGYRGRLGIYEVMLITAELRDLIRRGTGTDELRECARRAGMKTLREVGIQRAREGSTSLSEVLAVTSRL